VERIVAIIVLTLIPPLTAEQETRLQTARDGRDHREEAFVAIVENVRSGPWELGGDAVVLHPDHDAMIADPATHRGRLCRIEGVVQQATDLARPHDGITEWFVRDDDGRPILVYVVHAPERPGPGERDRIEMIVRFYKPIDAEGRDGVTRRYPAYVGTAPKAILRNTAGSSVSPLLIIALPLGILLVAFVFLLVYTRRQRRGDAPHHRVRTAPVEESEPPLPDDPAEALAEMKRRSDGA
jgi:hypothetical protein